VLNAFHVVKLGTQVVEEVRRHVQQDTNGHRGHKDDPLYKIRGLLRRGREHLTDKQSQAQHRPDRRRPRLGGHAGLALHQLRSMYQATDPIEVA
jgi:transposase